jgi:hypothetical protein
MHPSSLRRTQRSEESEGSIDIDLEYPSNGGMYVSNKDGVATWFTGDKTFTASGGDVDFLPGGTVHRFHNPGIQPAKVVFIYTPAGAEGIFVEGGDEPRPGVQAQVRRLVDCGRAAPPQSDRHRFSVERDRGRRRVTARSI